MRQKLNKRVAFALIITVAAGIILFALGLLYFVSGFAEEPTMEYIGDTKNGVPHGKGTLTYFNGPTYSGEFFEGKRHGKGLWMHQDGTTYNGEWQHNRYHGYGILEIPQHFIYEGEFVAGKKEGFGIQTWANGDRYEGNWEDDFMHGYGTMRYANGSRYSGEWEEGQKSGRGAMITSEEEIIRGEWAGNQHIAFPLEMISLGVEELTLKLGDEPYDLRLATYPPEASEPEVRWASSDPGIVNVEAGRITAVSTGRALITATTIDQEQEIQAWCWVQVITPYTAETSSGPTITSLRLEPSVITIRVGDDPVSFRVVIDPPGAATGNLEWGSSRQNVAIISESGVITPLRPGRAVITVLTPDGRRRATADLYVMGSLEIPQ